MAIIFNEGLPRSGKSYDACVNHILPALMQGRKVFAYINGLNHAKFAQVTGIPQKIIEMLLIQITADQIKTIYNFVENDSLVVIDELQNFFPVERKPLSDEMTLFVTEHGHLGLDILCMGQDLRDCHSLWKRRVAQKTIFVKLDALGRENNYSWSLYKATRPEVFKKVNSGTGRYDKKYFGLYKSHRDETNNKGNYKDKRALLFHSKGFRFGVPAFLVMLFYAVSYLMKFFGADASAGVNDAEVKSLPKNVPAEVRSSVISRRPDPPLAKPKEPPKPDQEELYYTDPAEYFNYAAELGRVRLSGIVETEDGSFFAYIDVLDGTYHLRERFTDRDLVALGWTLERHEYGLLASYKKKSHIIRMWPIDQQGRVANSYRQSGVLVSNPPLARR